MKNRHFSKDDKSSLADNAYVNIQNYTYNERIAGNANNDAHRAGSSVQPSFSSITFAPSIRPSLEQSSGEQS